MGSQLVSLFCTESEVKTARPRVYPVDEIAKFQCDIGEHNFKCFWPTFQKMFC